MKPEVSVIVCTYNRDRYIKDTLDHLKSQTFDQSNYEVVIINNNSTDSTDSICRKFVADNPDLNVHYFIENNQGHSHARNRGIKEARGKILSFIDDDAFVDPNFVDEIYSFFNNQKDAVAIGGKIIPVYESIRPTWMSPYLLPLVAALDMGNNVKPFKGRKFPIGANMAFRAEVFQTYGLFNVQLGRKGKGLEGGDEKEVFLRLKKQNESIYYVPQVSVRHIIPDSRITASYIKGLAVGVGTSEKTRLKNAGLGENLTKIFDEWIKLAATIVLALQYLIFFRPSKALMLLKFRFWVWKGLWFNQRTQDI